MRIRIATASDEGAVACILRNSYPYLLAALYEPDVLEEALKFMLRPNSELLASGRYYLIAKEGAPVGCGGWSTTAPWAPDISPGLAHLRHFGVAAQHSRCGVGRIIYEYCEAAARPHGVKRFEVHSSLYAEPFYAALGFERIGPLAIPLPSGRGFSGVHMSRDL
jgi:N-acetylglutamate synthase-like GNAT family acetyltransferase